jgi:hypothetical protein
VAFAADQHFRSFLNAFADIRLHSRVLFLGHHGPYRGLWIGWIAGGKGRDGIQDCLLDLGKPARRHEEPCARDARLPAVQKPDDKGVGDGRCQIRVVEQDVRRFTAQLERDALHRCGAVLHDRLAYRNRTGE